MSYERSNRSAGGRSCRTPTRGSEHAWTCVHCHQYVSGAPCVAGVHNRNHCPACLWSRHLDWRAAGDRLSACRAAMEPIGLTTKRSRNKYARERDGELMLVHRCTGCAAIVINRIAADDSAAALLDLFDRSCMFGAAVRTELSACGVFMLAAQDRELVRRRLWGTSRGEQGHAPHATPNDR